MLSPGAVLDNLLQAIAPWLMAIEEPEQYPWICRPKGGGLFIEARHGVLSASELLSALTLEIEIRGLAAEACFRSVHMDARGHLFFGSAAGSPDAEGPTAMARVASRRAAHAFIGILIAHGIPSRLRKGSSKAFEGT